jgi:hypothetical protein
VKVAGGLVMVEAAMGKVEAAMAEEAWVVAEA